MTFAAGPGAHAPSRHDGHAAIHQPCPGAAARRPLATATASNRALPALHRSARMPAAVQPRLWSRWFWRAARQVGLPRDGHRRSAGPRGGCARTRRPPPGDGSPKAGAGCHRAGSPVHRATAAPVAGSGCAALGRTGLAACPRRSGSLSTAARPRRRPGRNGRRAMRLRPVVA
ncbi:hypothetical protein D3C76_1083110 [compost metagenome]